MKINIIGAGLAGCEAAWYLAKKGYDITLYEMRPVKMTPAHKTEKFAELVCSNSLRSDSLENACGILKKEMEMLDSLIIKAARLHSVAAGGALAVDREGYSLYVTEVIKSLPNVEVRHEEITKINVDEPTIIATGPLTTGALCDEIKRLFGCDDFYFFDAQAPIIYADSINYDKVYLKSRYDKGEASYYNCPMTKEEFEKFYYALITAEGVEVKDFELKVFEGCMPIEIMAKRGIDTLRFGPLKPVGFTDPRTGERPYAIVQLRQDNSEGTLFNMVGFQTNLKFGEQKKVFSMIPGLENAEFVKYGVMHRNTYINSTVLLDETYNLKKNNNIFFAGQITGVEGYVESISSGLVAGINAANMALGKEKIVFPKDTVIGKLADYISTENNRFQPMNANFGILPPLEEKIKDKQLKYEKMANRAIASIKEFIN